MLIIVDENKYNDINEGKIFYKWIENLSHHYFNEFEFNVDGINLDNYSNDFLNIYQNHNITNDMRESYDKLIGNSNDIYVNNSWLTRG